MKVWDLIGKHYGAWNGLDGAGCVTIVPTAAGAASVDTRIMRFDAAADMPADITSAADVAGDVIVLDSFAATVTRLQMLWHGGRTSFSAVANAGPIAQGLLLTINPGDLATAINRLTYVNLTGAGVSSAGVADTFMLSDANPFIEINLDTELLEVYCIGIPVGFTPTNIIPSFAELRAIG